MTILYVFKNDRFSSKMHSWIQARIQGGAMGARAPSVIRLSHQHNKYKITYHFVLFLKIRIILSVFSAAVVSMSHTTITTFVSFYRCTSISYNTRTL